jgi:hypothetical protein
MYSNHVQIKESIWSQASKKMSMTSPCQIQDKIDGSCATVWTGLWRHLDAPHCPGGNDEDVRTSEQHRPDARSISIQKWVGFQKSILFGKSLQAVRTTWQQVRRMSSISEYSRAPFECGKDFSEDRSDARSSRPDVNLIKIELHYCWKDIAKNRPNVANFHLEARRPEPESL